MQGFTPLINGKGPEGNWTGLFEAGERVRLRLINSSAMTYYDIRVPGLEMTAVQADGNNVQPVTVDELRIAVAETYGQRIRCCRCDPRPGPCLRAALVELWPNLGDAG